MRQVSVRGVIARPIEEVHDFLLDSRNDERWCPLVSDIELVEGEPGVGAVYRYAQGQGPGRHPFTAYVRTIEAQRPTRIVWDDADLGRGPRYRSTIELADAGDGRTRVHHTNRVTMGSAAEQAAWFTAANVVLRLQLRNLRRLLDGADQ